MKITHIQAIEVLDSRGNPTVRTFVTLDDGSVGVSSVPSGASTGSHEATELRDQDPKRYQGLGVLNAVNNVNKIIAPKLVNSQSDKLDELDKLMIDLDGTPNKSKLGANAILSVSQALIKAKAVSERRPIWQIIHDFYFKDISPAYPKLMSNVINGGKHADWNFDIQEFIVIPLRQLPSESLKVASEIYHAIQKNLKSKKLSILVGDEGGFSPALNSNEEAFRIIIESAESIGYKNRKDYQLGIDGAASEFYKDGEYVFKKDNKIISGEELVDYYLSFENKYQVYSFEDIFAEDDWINWSLFKKRFNNNDLLVGDDLFCTNTGRMMMGHEKQAANATIIKPNQIGSIYETAEAIKLAKKYGWAVAVSHRSGETEDSFVADLAYASAADFLKDGAPARSDRVAKYNRLIEIENKL